METPTIRPALLSDLPALANLAQQTWAETFGDAINADDQATHLEETRSETFFADALRRTTVLVAETNGALVGYVQFGDVVIPEVDPAPGDQELQRLYVETRLQGLGLGRRLLEAALQHPRVAAAPRVFLQVWDENQRAVRLYERNGFRTVGTATFTIGSAVMEDLVMLLDRSAVARE